MKILIVDDSLTVRRIQKVTLNKIGYEDVEEAINGIEALWKLDNNKIDLVLLDYNMPEMNGYETLLEMKRNETLKNIPVIMVTTESEKEVVLKCLKAGARGFVVKPMTPDVIEAKIADAIY